MSPASDAVQTMRPPGGHDGREAADAEHDAVQVDGDRPAVAFDGELGGVGRASEHAGVEAGDVDRADRLPVVRLGDVEPVHDVERLDLEALGAKPRDERRSDARRRRR